MPPAWSPEKHNVHPYEKSDEEMIPELGLVTPPPTTSPQTIIKVKQTERGQQHIQWLLQKCPNLANIFHLHKQIGEGTFSAVFMASLLNDNEQSKLFAVKHLVPTTHPKRIQVELSCLKLIGGQDNVVGLDLCMRENENIVFIMPYIQHKPFSEYVNEMDVKEAVLYIKNLLVALRRVHSFGIIHRDVKPNNFLYDRTNKKFLLVDFGLAQVCSSNSPVANRTNITTNLSISQKRKRETDNPDEITTNSSNKQKSDFCEPAAKRPALQKRNINSLNSTVSYLQTTLNKNNTILSVAVAQSKENLQADMKEIIKKTPVNSSPFKGFKSPIKTISNATKIMKSPYKFTGLDLPPTHSKLQGKMPGQRRLFMDEESSKPIKFHKPMPSMTITTRHPLKAVSPAETKIKQIQQNLQQDCKCFNKASVCTICLLRKCLEAPRAGTPGYRPPEVLLKYPNQTTAVDIWAVGVIFLCILSGTFSFFRAPNDITALAEVISLFGDEHVKKVAKLLGRHFMCSEKKPALDLRKVCYKLRNRGKTTTNTTVKRCDSCQQFVHNCLCSGVPLKCEDDIFPESAYDLLKRLLDIDPYTRISAEEALKHPFLNIF